MARQGQAGTAAHRRQRGGTTNPAADIHYRRPGGARKGRLPYWNHPYEIDARTDSKAASSEQECDRKHMIEIADSELSDSNNPPQAYSTRTIDQTALHSSRVDPAKSGKEGGKGRSAHQARQRAPIDLARQGPDSDRSLGNAGPFSGFRLRKIDASGGPRPRNRLARVQLQCYLPFPPGRKCSDLQSTMTEPGTL